jgi:ElaB/YqjD/DUF883 family membrane-anchored ribosome-binding protein
MDARERQVADLKKQVQELSDRLEELAGTAQETAKGYLEDLGEVPEAIQDGLDSAKHSVKKVGGQVNDYVKENPWQVAGIAAAVGFVLAMASRRRD